MPPPTHTFIGFLSSLPNILVTVSRNLTSEMWPGPQGSVTSGLGGHIFFRNRKMLCGTPVGPKGRYLLNHWERHTRTVLEWLLCYISCPKTIFTSGEATHLFLSFWVKQLCTHTVLQRATSVLDAATGRILFHKYHRRPGFGFQNANCVGAGKQEPSRGECCSRRL